MDYYGYTDYGYTDYNAAGILGGIAIIGLIVILVSMAISIIQLIGMWKVFKKAGKGGWESLIPFYNEYVLIEISGLNWWWFLLIFSPFVLAFIGLGWLGVLVPIFVSFNTYYNLSKKFNKGIGFSICLTLFPVICIPILGFSKNNVYNNVPVSKNGVFGSSENNGNSNSYNYNNMNNNVNYNYQNNNNMQHFNNNTIGSMQQMGPTNEINNINNQDMTETQPQQFSFCGNCGTRLDSNVRFCPNCGKERI